MKYRGERLRFVNTHLEVASFPAVQEAQAREFLAGPAATDEALVAVGDFNSAADGTTTDSYDVLTGALVDAWLVNGDDPGWTSGQNGTLSNPVSQLDTRIALVLTRSAPRTRVSPLEAHVVGDAPFQQVGPAVALRPRGGRGDAGAALTERSAADPGILGGPRRPWHSLASHRADVHPRSGG